MKPTLMTMQKMLRSSGALPLYIVAIACVGCADEGLRMTSQESRIGKYRHVLLTHPQGGDEVRDRDRALLRDQLGCLLRKKAHFVQIMSLAVDEKAALSFLRE